MTKSWLRNALEKEGITATQIRETTGMSFDAIRNRMNNPYKFLTFKQIVEIFSLLEDKGYSFSTVIKNIVGTKYKGEQRKWYELDEDEYK